MIYVKDWETWLKVPEKKKFVLEPQVSWYFSTGRSEKLSSIFPLQAFPVIYKKLLASILQFYLDMHSKTYTCYMILHQYLHT